MTEGKNQPSRYELRRVLRLWDSIAVIIGIIVGSGIFFTPTTVARHITDPTSILLVWTIGGVAALLGALTYAELASIWPRTGGMYIFLRESYGSLVSFLFGWAQLLIIRPSAVAAISVIFAQYVGYFLNLSKSGIQMMAIIAVLMVSIINYLGVRLSSLILNVLTSIKVIVLALIAIFGLLLFKGESGFFVANAEVQTATSGLSIWSAVSIALIGVFWTFDGWTEITAVAGEVKDPRKTIPKALVLGTVGITLIYLFVNAALIHTLSPSGMAQSERVAADAMILIFGPIGGALIAIAVMISTFGALNGTTLTGPRIYFAMAVDGLFFRWARKVHPQYRSPSTAIILQSVLSIPLIITWSFDQLATYFVFVSLIFYSLCTFSIFLVRRRKDLPEDRYKTWGYPFTPVLFLLVSIGILLNAVVDSVEQSGVALAILLSGIPFYYVWKRSKRSGKS